MPAIKQLMSVVESLLREKALDEITVSEIVAERSSAKKHFTAIIPISMIWRIPITL